MDEGKRRDVALFRYTLVRQAADAALSGRERGELVRSLAALDHLGPFGGSLQPSRATLDRWVRTLRQGGFQALYPAERASVPRTPAEILDLAVALKKENPRRTATAVRDMLVEVRGWAPHVRTIQRHFARLGLNRRPDGRPPRAYGRFEASRPNELWSGDCLHGPPVGGRKTFLFAFIDDHSRLLPGYRWVLLEDQLRMRRALRTGLASRGVPDAIYVDNGSPYVSKDFLAACACLGIRLVHSRPGEPAGRGKIERFFRTVRDQFLVEIETKDLDAITVDDMNRLFSAWVETVYHRRVHTETGQTPLERWAAAPPTRPLPTPDELHEAFLWTECRTVTKTATVNLHGNIFEVDPHLAGARVELRFDPFDLCHVEVFYQGRPVGEARAHRMGRWVRHPQARPDPDDEPPARTGIDYLDLIAARHDQADKRKIGYSDLHAPTNDNTDPTRGDNPK